MSDKNNFSVNFINLNSPSGRLYKGDRIQTINSNSQFIEKKYKILDIYEIGFYFKYPKIFNIDCAVCSFA